MADEQLIRAVEARYKVSKGGARALVDIYRRRKPHTGAAWKLHDMGLVRPVHWHPLSSDYTWRLADRVALEIDGIVLGLDKP